METFNLAQEAKDYRSCSEQLWRVGLHLIAVVFHFQETSKSDKTLWLLTRMLNEKRSLLLGFPNVGKNFLNQIVWEHSLGIKLGNIKYLVSKKNTILAFAILLDIR